MIAQFMDAVTGTAVYINPAYVAWPSAPIRPTPTMSASSSSETGNLSG